MRTDEGLLAAIKRMAATSPQVADAEVDARIDRAIRMAWLNGKLPDLLCVFQDGEWWEVDLVGRTKRMIE